MKQTLRTRSKTPRGTESETTISDTGQVEAVFGALEDQDCRDILAATSDQSLTANELSERCDLALSTAYRKLELLTEAGLLDEQLRLARSGKHTNEYVRSIDDIHVSIEGDIELAVTHSNAEESGPAVFAGAD